MIHPSVGHSIYYIKRKENKKMKNKNKRALKKTHLINEKLN